MFINPFSEQDPDRRAIWDMLVDRDIRAFLRADWEMVDGDFVQEGFMGIHAGLLRNPDAWRLSFPDVNTYRDEWLRQAEAFKVFQWGEDIQSAMFRVTVLRDIEIKGCQAVAHKKFLGQIRKADGTAQSMDWQTLYYCRKAEGRWKISGFTGYMPHFFGIEQQDLPVRVPPHARQHKTAGPYSPVLEVALNKLVVVSGQAALDEAGKVVGKTIEEQTTCTMDHCRRLLSAAGSGLDQVFKVNVYLKQLEDWQRFNAVYRKYFTGTLPVRTAVRADLLMNLLVEIEMWAVKL